jgi:putative phosphoesterase
MTDHDEPLHEQRIGVISDTHGLLRPSAREALAGCHLIIHAGDVGRLEVLEGLRAIAPVAAVCGNVDRGDWPEDLPRTRVVQAGDLFLYVVHNIADLDLDPAGGGFSAVIFGHSHKPSIAYRNGVLFLNPGAAGPRRFTLPVSLALLHVRGHALQPELVRLEES